MGLLGALFRKSPTLNKAAILSTFHATLNNLKGADHFTQIVVGRKVWGDLEAISRMSPPQLSTQQPRMFAKYRDLRHEALRSGAKNDCDPDFAYAALMESLAASLGDEVICAEIGRSLMEWLHEIGVIEREREA
jgi:arginyl-tRNA--protein-N-Asp/Glu arginylyltransferase